MATWHWYKTEPYFDELLSIDAKKHSQLVDFGKKLAGLKRQELKSIQQSAQNAIKETGITFSIYTEQTGMIDRAWPFDVIPRLIPESNWKQVSQGLKQRVKALNLFIDDIYHKQKIVKDGVFPKEVLDSSSNYRKECAGMNLKHKVWAHICGTDLVRDENGTFLVLEDNLRVPSGVSYMLENRQITKRVFPELLEHLSILPVDDYSSQLHETLSSLAPRKIKHPEIVVLTPGIYNSAYFEHTYLAMQMGCDLVEGRDLVVENDFVYKKTITGLIKVDVIYRRIDDLFIDPKVFNKDSMLGVPGMIKAWQKGNVAIANAPGAGVADDKVVYAYVPQVIRYYLDQDPILPNVPTYLCTDKKQRDHILANLENMVVKPANESGGYGMLIGPKSTKRQRRQFARKITYSPRNFIAQPALKLSTCPTLIGDRIEARHLDLRPFILSAKNTYVTTGGLTRVALKKNSLVVNSSQGGGSKDTLIIAGT